MYTTTLTHSRLVQFQMQLHCQKHLKWEKKQDCTQTKLLQIISFVFFLAALIIIMFQKGNNWHFCHQEQNFWKNTMKLHLVALKRSISNYSFLNAPVINIVAPMNWHLDLNSPKQNPNTNQASFFTPLKGNWCGKRKLLNIFVYKLLVLPLLWLLIESGQQKLVHLLLWKTLQHSFLSYLIWSAWKTQKVHILYTHSTNSILCTRQALWSL